MMSPDSDQNDDYFNDNANGDSNQQDQNMSDGAGPNAKTGNSAVPRAKRMACILCRKRKLKCDGNKPSCGTCSRLKHHCEYSEERKKSGPKRGYVKLLEARLKQVEDLLDTRDVNDTATTTSSSNVNVNVEKNVMASEGLAAFVNGGMQSILQDNSFIDPGLNNIPDFGLNNGNDFSWEMIGLGLEEALPPQDIVDELTDIFFDKIHPSLPMIHRTRFLSSMNLAPHMRPPISLRYAMWTHACSVTAKYSAYTEHFYARARKYIEQDEMRGHGESVVTMAHSQAWTLIACYEFKLMFFPRAWMSVGRASRLAQMMGLHRQDGVGLDVKQTLPPPRDWIEREERRRTFWMAYCQDRYASIGTGWPMTIDEQDILTNLPASEEAYNRGRPETSPQLSDVLNGDGASSLSSFAGVVLMATIYGRNLTHLHRPTDKDYDHDLNGEFWKRHRTLDNILLNVSLSMPEGLRLPAGMQDPNAIHFNMNIHTATICLHQAAIYKADKNRLPAQISAESKRRCIVAADQTTNIMRMISHIDLSIMNPFMAFNLYVASRVFVQYLKSRREDAAVKSSLHFLLAAMQILKVKNPLTESFLVQLDVDLEGSNLDIPSNFRQQQYSQTPPDMVSGPDNVHCSPLYDIRQTQGAGHVTREVHPPWPSDKNNTPNSNNSNYPNLFANTTSPQIEVNDCAKIQPMEHMPQTNFDGVDSLYGQPAQPQNPITSPDYFNAEDHSSRSHSAQPTPSTNSNRASSYQPFTPPQNNLSSFNTTSGPQTGDQLPYVGAMNMNATTSSNNLTANWNFIPQQQQSQPQPQPTKPDPQQQQDNFNFVNNTGGGLGMTPGATGMTPLPDSLWQSVNDGGDWMYGWNASSQPSQ